MSTSDMYVCMCIYIYIHIHIHMHIQLYIYIYMSYSNMYHSIFEYIIVGPCALGRRREDREARVSLARFALYTIILHDARLYYILYYTTT